MDLRRARLMCTSLPLSLTPHSLSLYVSFCHQFFQQSQEHHSRKPRESHSNVPRFALEVPEHSTSDRSLTSILYALRLNILFVLYAHSNRGENMLVPQVGTGLSFQLRMETFQQVTGNIFVS